LFFRKTYEIIPTQSGDKLVNKEALHLTLEWQYSKPQHLKQNNTPIKEWLEINILGSLSFL
jgi:hypothetical protein